MAFPKINICGKVIILLSGYKDQSDNSVTIEAEDDLLLAIEKDPEAVAFGYVVGAWIAGA